MRRLALLASTLVAVASILPSTGSEFAGGEPALSQVPAAVRGRHPLAMAFRRSRLLVRLVGRQSPAAAQAHADAGEHQRAWSEHSRAAERFHAIVLEAKVRPGGKPDGAPQSG